MARASEERPAEAADSSCETGSGGGDAAPEEVFEYAPCDPCDKPTQAWLLSSTMGPQNAYPPPEAFREGVAPVPVAVPAGDIVA